MGRKRKRAAAPLPPTRRSNNHDELHNTATIRAVVEKESQVLLFREFVKRWVPNLSLPVQLQSEMIEHMVFVPSSAMKNLKHVIQAECRESVSSLVDDAVWSLVQRRERSKRLGEDGRNVLAQGYVLSTFAAEHGAIPSHGMRTGLQCNQPNDKVSFWKTSPLIRQLHTLLGDEVFRCILLYTRLFVPLQDPKSSFRGNYMLVCGDHLRLTMDPRKQNQSVLPSLHQTSSNFSPESDVQKKRRCFDSTRPSFLQPSASVSRHALYYNDSYYPEAGLPQTHILNKDCSSKELLFEIFKLKKEESNYSKRWKRLREHGLDTCQNILKGHRKCDYHRLLDRYCPLPGSLSKRESCETRSNLTIAEVSVLYTSVDKVSSFLKAVLVRVLPDTFWGSDQNRNSFFGSLDSFLTLRRKEKVPNKLFMDGVRVSKMSWLYGNQKSKRHVPRTEHEIVTVLTVQAFRWVLESIVIPLLRSTFYVTETEFGANLVMYYRKPVWSLFRTLAFGKLLQVQFVEIGPAEAKSRLSSQAMGFSRLRLLPKATGVRPIAHLSRRERVSLDNISQLESDGVNSSELKSSNQSTNAVLAVVFDVLKYEIERDSSSCGAGLDGLSSFYPKYREFLSKVKASRPSGDLAELYFASVDIQKCYDTIHQKRLTQINHRRKSLGSRLSCPTNSLLPAISWHANGQKDKYEMRWTPRAVQVN